MIRVHYLIDGEIGDTACFLGHNRDRRRKRTAGIRADKMILYTLFIFIQLQVLEQIK
jgi:hypothetical protein